MKASLEVDSTRPFSWFIPLVDAEKSSPDPNDLKNNLSGGDSNDINRRSCHDLRSYFLRRFVVYFFLYLYI
jgi:hypothetical protein